jgi:OOP family OmpA-OmpF porin
MYSNKKTFGVWLGGIFVGAALASGAVHAESRGTAPGYVTDSRGNIVMSGTGECWHSSDWTPDKATIVGCDGVVADVTVEVIEGAPTGIVEAIVIPATALFAFDKADLTPEAENTVDEYLRKYREDWRPELAHAYEAIVIGHTDSVGDANYNLGLSKRRAEAVRDFLVAEDVPPEKLRVLGRGENDPIASNDTKEGRALNRRVEVIVIGEARALDTMRFPSVALFPRRSAELSPQGKQLLDKQVEEGRGQLKRAVLIEIIGHTDDVGDDDYNQELSEQRAKAVRDYLVVTGVDPSKMVTWGAGEKMPIASNATEQGRADNRRVEVLVLGRLKQ